GVVWKTASTDGQADGRTSMTDCREARSGISKVEGEYRSFSVTVTGVDTRCPFAFRFRREDGSARFS
ncbi:unnamed protein product, partial [Macrosiphum euphorbiae]